MLIGGVATTSLSQFTTPILFARGSLTGSLKGTQILVASDGRGGLRSHRGYRRATRTEPGRTGHPRERPRRRVEDRSHGPSRRRRARCNSRLPNAGEPYVEPGKAWDVILDAAKHTEAALVVMGSRRLTGLHAFGSVSRRVVHDAPCSVLVIPPGQ